MRFTAQEEYGLRCLLQIARAPEGFRTIAQVAERESLTQAYVAKLMRLLRRGELLTSIRGQKGGYRLSRPPSEISVASALVALGGKFYSRQFCADHSGNGAVCVHDVDCSIRSIWMTLDSVVWNALSAIRLSDLLCDEQAMGVRARRQVAPLQIESSPGLRGREESRQP